MRAPTAAAADGRGLPAGQVLERREPARPPAWWDAWRAAMRAGQARPGLSAELRAEAARAAGFSVRA